MNYYFFQISAVIVIQMSWQYWVIVVGLVIGGGTLFFVLSFLGGKMLQWVTIFNNIKKLFEGADIRDRK